MRNNYLLSALMLFLLTNMVKAQNYRAILSGNHEPFPVLSTASGDISVSLTGDTLTVSGPLSGIASGIDTSIAGGAHIHNGIAGMNGGIAIGLKPTLSEGLNDGLFEIASNTFILDEDLKTALNERKLYINVHSIDHGGGEIRGQILPEAEEYYAANLFGSNATNSIMSDARGSVVMEVSGNTVTLSGSFSGLSSALATNVAGGIHIHEAKAGSNGGILQGLKVVLSADSLSAEIPADSNTFAVTEEQLATLRADGWYVNVHSSQFSSGEIRGQLTPMATAKFRASLTGTSQSPPVTSYARGKVTLGLNGNTLTLSGSFTGLESDINTSVAGGAHIHIGMAGRNGSIAFPLTMNIGNDNRSATFDPADNTFTVTGDTLQALLGRGLYVNVHSLNHSGGEIRGQILPESQYFLNAYLTASQQSASIVSAGDGAVIFEVLGDQCTASGTFRNLGSPLAINVGGGAHIHFAPAGSNGPIRFGLTTTPEDVNTNGRFRASDNTFELSATRRDSVRARLAYVNVHSENVPGGEIRGQLLHEAVAYFYTPLSGAEQTPSVNTGAMGAVAMEYTGAAAVFSGSFRNLSSALATQIMGGTHLHFGLAGSNGPIITSLAVTSADSINGLYHPTDNIYPVSQGWVDTVRNRMAYVNVHSANFAGGEIRGNLRPLSQNLYLANLRGRNSVVPFASTGIGAVLIEQNGNNFVASGSFRDLAGDFADNIAGGSHVHSGMSGMAGGIIFGLNSEISEDLKSGVYLADSNRITVPDSVTAMITAGHSYVNIHSSLVTSGEIRGQILPEINLAPDPVIFVSPESGDSIDISGDPATVFTAQWEPSADPNNNRVVYIWQLSTTPDFSLEAIAVNTGENPLFETTYGAIDTLLSLLGVDSGEVVTIYHRVAASDGSLSSDATIDSVYLIKGVITSVRENPYFDDLFALYPSPALANINLQLEMKQSAEAFVNIIDLSGKILYQQRTPLLAGHNLIQRNVSSLNPGTYIAQIVINRQVTAARQFTKL